MRFRAIAVFMCAISVTSFSNWAAGGKKQRSCQVELGDTVRLNSNIIIANAQHVHIKTDRIAEIAQHLLENHDFSYPKWDWPPTYPQFESPSELAAYYLVVNAVNYSFFSENKATWLEPYRQGKDYGSLLAAQKITEHWEFLRANEYEALRAMTPKALLSEIYSEADIPISMASKRSAALNEVGFFLRSVERQFKSNEQPVLAWMKKHAQGNPMMLAHELEKYLPSWEDPFMKRSQLAVFMIWGRLQDTAHADFVDPEQFDTLTAIADYRVPQTLYSLGLVEFSDELKEVLQSKQPIAEDVIYERELRAATVVLGDQLLAALRNLDQQGRRITALELDFLLWAMNKKEELRVLNIRQPLPHHYTFTTRY